LLFTIDPRPFQAEVDRLKAELERAKAQLAVPRAILRAPSGLHNNNGMSIEEYDRRNSALAEAVGAGGFGGEKRRCVARN